FGVAADVWSVTSYGELRRDALDCERWNLLHPQEEPRVPYITRMLNGEPVPVVATCDSMKAVPDQVARWVPGGLYSLGTDGFGRSEARAELRDYFEVDRKYVTLAALRSLVGKGSLPAEVLSQTVRTLGIDAEKPNPLTPPRPEPAAG
ncbi:MAG: pyruvate dehydrogenase (acetyl-transferring), homodimeric type, partial [Planctomycetota bacterium]